MHSIPVEIVLAAYKGEKYIKEQLESLLNQTHSNITIICRDDDVDNATGNIIADYKKKYPQKIVILPHGKRLGPVGNFNAVLEASSCDYVLLCDQDDIWKHDKIQRCLSAIIASENKFGKKMPLLVHTDLEVVDAQGMLLHPSFWKYSGLQVAKGRSFNRILMQNCVTGCTVIVNRALLDIALPLPQQALMHDWWLALVASAFGAVIEDKYPAILYRQHDKNTLGAQNFWSLNNIKNKLKNYNSFNLKKCEQAREFYRRYEKQVKAPQVDILMAFLNLTEKNYLARNYDIIKHGLFKHGFLRTAYTLLSSAAP